VNGKRKDRGRGEKRNKEAGGEGAKNRNLAKGGQKGGVLVHGTSPAMKTRSIYAGKKRKKEKIMGG